MTESAEDFSPALRPNAEQGASVHRVSIKPPVFMENSVEGWFLILESQFHLQTITSSITRFHHVLAALPPDVVCKLPVSCIQTPNFENLKTEVIGLFERSKPELFEELISKAGITGRPSAFMRELQSIARKVGVSDDLVRHRFTQSLPAAIGLVLAAQKEMPSFQLAKLADELAPLAISSAESSPVFSVPTRRQLPARQPTRHHGGLQPFHEGQRPRVCRAHIFFGSQARTCKPWCKWPSKSSALRMQPSSRPSSPAPVDNVDVQPSN